MSTLPIDKWIHGVLPGDAVSIAAKRSLHTWLGAVQHYLPLAALEYKDDSDYVLKLRVWSRRSAAALKLYTELLPPKKACTLRKQMRELRKAVSVARDYDVLIARLAGNSSDPKNKLALKKVRKKRKRAQQPLKELHRKISKNDRFNRSVASLLEKVRSHEEGAPVTEDQRFDSWAKNKLRPMADTFLNMLQARPMEAEGLHRVRLRAKDLRYTMELLGAAFTPDFACKLYPLIEAIQDKLGEINDLVVEQGYMRKRLAKSRDLTTARHLKAQLAGKQSHLSYLIHEFHYWLSPELLHSLRQSFDEHLDDYQLQLIHRERA